MKRSVASIKQQIADTVKEPEAYGFSSRNAIAFEVLCLVDEAIDSANEGLQSNGLYFVEALEEKTSPENRYDSMWMLKTNYLNLVAESVTLFEEPGKGYPNVDDNGLLFTPDEIQSYGLSDNSKYRKVLYKEA